jgi:hypothetical protein
MERRQSLSQILPQRIGAQRRSDQPGAECPHARIADPPILSVVEQLQHSTLALRPEVSDLIEHESPIPGRVDQSIARASRSGERSASVPEQLRAEQRRR